MKIRLDADYAPWPIWGPGGLMGEDEVPLSDALKDRIRAWFNAYDSSPRTDWPMWQAPEGSTDEEEAWVQEGASLRDLIAAELGPRCEVEFRS